MELNRDNLIETLAGMLTPVVGNRGAEILLARASGHRLEELGGRYGITRERVRQLETIALWHAPEEVFPALAQLSSLTPDPASIQKKLAVVARKRMKAYIISHPAEAHDYQLIHKRCGIAPKTPDKLYGDDALMQLYREYGVNRIGSELHCTQCDSFKHKDEFPPKTNVGGPTLICRPCNTRRMRDRWRDHYDKAIAYSRYYNKTPQARAYYKAWREKNKDLINARQRERNKHLTPEQKEKRRTWARNRYQRMKLGLVGGASAGVDGK